MSRSRALECAALTVALAVWPVVAHATVAKRRSSTVKAALLEYKIKPKPRRARAGNVAFRARNIGGSPHELVVVRATPNGGLPTKTDGSVDETQIPTSDKFGAVRNLRSKKSRTLTIKNLPAGSYTLFCNIVEQNPNGTPLSHYAQGMFVPFTVT